MGGGERADAGSPAMPPQSQPEIEMEDVAMVAVVLGFALAGLRMWLHRPRVKELVAPTTNPALEARLDRLENAIEAMTIEVERVTEGQRFTTKLLSEMHDTSRALGAGR